MATKKLAPKAGAVKTKTVSKKKVHTILSGKVKMSKPPKKVKKADSIFSPDYTVTSTVDHNGRLLKNVEVICCFWGRFWTRTSPAPSPSASEYALAIQFMLTGTYLSKMSQYRGIGKGTLVYCDFNDSTDPVDDYTNQNVIDMLKNRFQNTNMPNPANSHDRFYAVIVPPGIRNSIHQYAGEHGSFDYNSTKAYYAWIGNTGSLTGHDCVTKVFSHELTEVMSDPDVDNTSAKGILVNGTGVTNDEIGDTCNNQFATVNANGVNCTLQSYWSKEDNACVLPVDPPKNAALEITAIRKVYSSSLRLHYIDKVKAIGAGRTYWLHRSEVINLMLSNNNSFFVNGDDGTHSDVMIERHYIRTRSDWSKRDNLLSLPSF